MAEIKAKAAGGNWSAKGTWEPESVPTAADDVVLNAASGNVTIDAASVCRSLDCTGYTKTLTHNAAISLQIGDATAGAGNIALKFVAGMTYTAASSTTSQLKFISTSGTAQTVDLAGKKHGNLSFEGIAGSWKLTGESVGLSLTATAVTHSRGTLDTNGQTCSWGAFNGSFNNNRTLKLGASKITMGGTTSAWNITTTTLLTFEPGTSEIVFEGTSAVFASGGLTYYDITCLKGGEQLFEGNFTCRNFKHIGTANKEITMRLIGTTVTVTGTLTITGNSAINRILLRGGTYGTQTVVKAAAVSLSNADFQDIKAEGAAIPFTGTSMGDALGNSNITFDESTTQTHTASAGGNWSDVTKWTSRVPLPQDDVVVNGSTTGTLSANMPRLGRKLTFTGFAGTLAILVDSSFFGDLVLGSGMTLNGGETLRFRSRSAGATLTTAGVTMTTRLVISTALNGGSCTLQDDLTIGGSLVVQSGVLKSNNKNVTAEKVIVEITGSKVELGSGTWTLTSTAATTIWEAAGSVIVTGGGKIVVGTASTNTRIFAGGGKIYDSLEYKVAGSTGTLQINGSNTFTDLIFSDETNARTLVLAANSTTTITGKFTVNGTSGKLVSLRSSTEGTQYTLSKASGLVQVDYLSIKDSKATGGARWLAGFNSTNVSGNTGWEFNVAPEVKKGAAAMSALTNWSDVGVRRRFGRSQPSGESNETAVGRLRAGGKASNDSSASASATSERRRFSGATASAQSNLGAGANFIASAKCNMSANTSVSDSGVVRKFGRSQNSSLTNWSAKGRARLVGVAAQTATASIDVDAIRSRRGKSSGSGSGSMEAGGERHRTGKATMVGSGTFEADSLAQRLGSATFTATGTMNLKIHVEGGYGSIFDQSVGSATVNDEPVGSATISQEP